MFIQFGCIFRLGASDIVTDRDVGGELDDGRVAGTLP